MNTTAYFDNATTTFPKPKIVYEQMISNYKEFGVSPGRGQYSLASKALSVVSETRDLLLKYLKAPQYVDTVIWTKSATEALNICINSLLSKYHHKKNLERSLSNINMTGYEHNAITRTLNAINKGSSNDLDSNIFTIAPFNSNVTGEVLNINKTNGVKLDILDCAASVGYYDIDFSKAKYTIISGHKGLYGPTGVAAIICKYDDAELLKPLVYGGTGLNSKEQDLMQVDLPDRLEAGTSNILSIFGLRAALEWHIKKDDDIKEKTILNFKKMIALLSDYSNIKIIEPYSYPIVSCLFDNYTPDEIGKILNKKNVAVRTGLHCSPSAHKKIKTFPEGTVRFSCSYFTNDNDFAILKNALDYILES
jgi:selenocysteine lyase/cysteine desulfurase